MKNLKKFNPTYLEKNEILEWIKTGDVYEAEQVAARFATTLYCLAKSFKELQTIHMREHGGIFFTEPEVLIFIADCLIAKASDTPGKVRKSGAELFAKMLVPNKPIKSQFRAQWIASIAYQVGARSDANSEITAELINVVIQKNNAILDSFRSGKITNLDGYSPAIPEQEVTPSQVEKALRKFKAKIDLVEKK